MRENREGTCGFEGCGRPIKARRLCAGHYQQSWEGREMHPLITFADAETRFRSKLSSSDPDECWEWTGMKEPSGYGVFKVRGENTKTHRFSYELENGPIPEGLEVDHQCRNRACANPAHLKAVTRSENRQNIEAYSNNRLGVRGVTQVGRRFAVTVQSKGVSYKGGRFDTLEEAEKAARDLRNRVQTNNVQDWND